MISKSSRTFTAQVTIGLFRGYSKKSISIPEFKEVLLEAQQNIKAQYKIELSTKLMHCEIFFLGQEEPSMEMHLSSIQNFHKKNQNSKMQ